MERERYSEMIDNLKRLADEGVLGSTESSRLSVFLFAHCDATMKLADELLKIRIKPAGILDNNSAKYGLFYKGIPVCDPQTAVRNVHFGNAIILIVSRFYDQMASQMRELGFEGRIEKLTDYNTYTEYSLSPDTLIKKSERLNRGLEQLKNLKTSYPEHFIVFCPFPALGDIYFCMSYLRPYLDAIHCKKIKNESSSKSTNMSHYKCLVCVVGNAQKQVAELFDYATVLKLNQKEIDEMIQAVIYTDDPDCYIAHQDRPYVVDLHKALYRKCIPLETIYKCGIFGLPQHTEPAKPVNWEEFKYPGEQAVHEPSKKMVEEWFDKKNAHSYKSVIISPYAKSVPSLPNDLWKDLVNDLAELGYELFTNVCGDEKALPGTKPISPKISEMKSAVEQAGLFIGIRSGMCDVIKIADCKKIALYPDYFYCDTKWKSIDMYSIDGFQNIVVKNGDLWEEVKKRIKL